MFFTLSALKGPAIFNDLNTAAGAVYGLQVPKTCSLFTYHCFCSYEM